MTRRDPQPADPGSMTAAMRALPAPQNLNAGETGNRTPQTETHLRLALGRARRLAETVSLAPGEAASIDRSVLTSKHGTRSAGVNVTALSRDTGGVALAGRETTKVDVPIGSTGEGGVRKPRELDARQRSIEEIRRVFDSNKGAIFAIYNRALRQDPTLQGKVVLELVISPSGQVMDCKVVASEITDEAVVAKIINRIRMFNFGKRDVGTTTISYPVHFLPT